MVPAHPDPVVAAEPLAINLWSDARIPKEAEAARLRKGTIMTPARLIVAALVLPLSVSALVLALSAPASATGNVRIQQRDGSVKTYTGVILKVAHKSLTLISADRVSTVAISGAVCAHDGALVRCTGGGFSLLQDGKRHIVPFKSATFYFNPTDQDQLLPLSTMKIGPHSVIFAVQTAKGTYVTGNGKLDEAPTQ